MSTCGCDGKPDTTMAKATAATLPHSERQPRNHLNIDLLYIDLSVCERCQGTESHLDEAIVSLTPLLEHFGYSVQLNKILVASEEQARDLKFVTSPTIRINGQDMQRHTQESPCSSCSSLVDDQPVACRSWHYKGASYDIPPTEMIVGAITSHLFPSPQIDADTSTAPGAVPENLKRFFAARTQGAPGASPRSCNSTGCGCNS